MSCGVGYRRSSDPELLWLWCRPAAPALIRPLAWELPYAVGAVLKRQKQTNKQVLLMNICEKIKNKNTDHELKNWKVWEKVKQLSIRQIKVSISGETM